MFIDVFVEALAVKVPTELPFFCMVMVALFTVGMDADIDAMPLDTDASVPLNFTPVSVPVLDVLLFQLEMSDAVIPAATDAEKTGSDSVVIPPPEMVWVLVPTEVICPAAS